MSGSPSMATGGGKGGGQNVMARPEGLYAAQPAPATTATTTAPYAMTQPTTPNVYQQSAGAYNAALGGTAQAMAGPNIGQFMNPYTQMVTGRTLSDLERQRQMAINTTGAQATQAGAFGGSRHGVAEALTNEGFARQGANALAELNQGGFDRALAAGLEQQNIGLQGASQLGALSNLGFGYGQQIGQQQTAQGMLTQSMAQDLINAARGQYTAENEYEQQAFQNQLAALAAAASLGEGTTTGTATKNPGLFDYLTLGASFMASDRRLKTNIEPLNKIGGVQFYEWDWTEEAKGIVGDQEPVGVIADEIEADYPQFVVTGDDGFKRVNYAGLAQALSEAA